MSLRLLRLSLGFGPPELDTPVLYNPFFCHHSHPEPLHAANVVFLKKWNDNFLFPLGLGVQQEVKMPLF